MFSYPSSEAVLLTVSEHGGLPGGAPQVGVIPRHAGGGRPGELHADQKLRMLIRI